MDENRDHEPLNTQTDQADSEPSQESTQESTQEPTAQVTPASAADTSSEEHFMQSVSSSHEEEGHDHEDEIEAPEDYSLLSKEDAVDRLEQLVQNIDLNSVKGAFHAIREHVAALFAEINDTALAKFIEDGGIKDDFSPVTDKLEERFQNAVKLFFKRKSEQAEQIEKQRNENLKVKSDLLKDFKELIQNEDNMKKAYDIFHDLQARWRAAGPVPPANVRDIQMTYKFYVDKFYDYIRINKELQELDNKRNLETKLGLCEQAETLLLEPSVNTAVRTLHMLQDKWRETGPVPREQKEAIWDRFKAACDKVFERRKEHQQKLSEQFGKNMEAKEALIAAADAIIPDEKWKVKDWTNATQSLLDLQTQWKKTGPVAKKVSDEIWNKFRASFDKFYKAKNEFFQKRKQEFAANLQQKTELCIQAEALQNSTDWKTTTAELIRLQQDWKNTGPVGDKQKDKIWKRFRTACDTFFKNKSAHFAESDKQFEENYIKKIKLIEEIEAFKTGSDTENDFEQLKQFQRQWTETGMVPLAKKDEVQKRFKKVMDLHYNALRANRGSGGSGMRTFKSNVKYSGKGEDKMDPQRRTLMSKIAELKNDVQVWENNLGFFAKSKNADSLKKEFETKIETAKQEIARLNEKLKSDS